jgi:uncharacterized membrane protein YfcA
LPDTTFTYPILGVAAFFGGAINAIAGGGTLLTFPTLLSVVSPVAANATSTFALLPGSLSSAWGYREELAHTKRQLALLWPPSLIGGSLGALAVTRFPERVFENLVPWLLLLATTLLLLQRPLAKRIAAHPHDKPSARTSATIVFFQFLVGVYGGYFGAGIGILMLSSLAFMGIPDIHRMNGLKAILASTMNGVTILIFLIEGVIVWKYALLMAGASIAGGYAGARMARRMPQAYVRSIVIAIGFGVAGYAFYRRFFSA